MEAAGILGILGFALGIGMACLEIRRYRLPLHLRVHDIELVDSSEDAYFFVIRLAFVNPATRGRTVYRVAAGEPNEAIAWKPNSYQCRTGRSIVIGKLPNTDIETQISKDERLQVPLDIPPHQSRTGLIPVLIHKDTEVIHTQKVRLRLDAFDISKKKPIAKFDEVIDLHTHIL
ncbi:MAG TPA: hypothetical protein VMX96_11145 [Dehalococcoidia bacterium]|nr:hypothetical protein [Dehalococcoidia bacterium]